MLGSYSLTAEDFFELFIELFDFYLVFLFGSLRGEWLHFFEWLGWEIARTIRAETRFIHRTLYLFNNEMPDDLLFELELFFEIFYMFRRHGESRPTKVAVGVVESSNLNRVSKASFFRFLNFADKSPRILDRASYFSRNAKDLIFGDFRADEVGDFVPLNFLVHTFSTALFDCSLFAHMHIEANVPRNCSKSFGFLQDRFLN